MRSLSCTSFKSRTHVHCKQTDGGYFDCENMSPQKMPCQKLGRIDVWLGTERPTHSGTLPQESSNIRTHFCFTEPLGLEIEQVLQPGKAVIEANLHVPLGQRTGARATQTQQNSLFLASKCPRAWAVIQFHFMLLRDVVDCGFYRSTCHPLTCAFRSCYFKFRNGPLAIRSARF